MVKLSTIAALGVVMISVTALLPAEAKELLGGPTVSPHSTTVTTTKTLYLHSITPSGNAEELAEFGVGTATTTTMDESAPATPAPKVTQTSSGNQLYWKNFLLGYWAAPLTANVESASADLWVSGADGPLSVSLLADGSSAPFSTVTATIAPGPARLVHVDMPLAKGTVGHELLLQVYAGTAGDQFYYDGSLMPSALTVTLSPYVAPPVGGGMAWTPSPGWGAVTSVNTTLAARETSLVIDPTNEDNMFLCAPSGVPNTPYGQSYFYKSSDAGASWQYVRVETDQTDLRQYTFEGGDCDVAYDAVGTMYSADTWLGDLSVGHSTDGGLTWAGTPLAVTSPIVDRPWLVGGPAGTIHVSYQDVQFGMPTAIWYTRSTDGGVTFLPAVPVALADPNNPFSWEGNFVLTPDQQHIFLVYNKRANGVVGVSSDAEEVWVAASNDAGATWSSTRIASTENSASYLYPSIGMDSAGGLHVVYASSTGSDQPIWYTHSADGASWSAPVPIQRGSSGYAPWVVGGNAGEAAIQWLGTPTTVNATSTDADWFFYWARVAGADTPSTTIASGTTTSTPIFHGTHSATPEFNQVRLDSNGKMRMGMSAFFTPAGGSGANWAEFYQAEN
ncbi:MAG: exo-alpha-sialidase [Candidatus Thermoplasmatota archaeon]